MQTLTRIRLTAGAALAALALSTAPIGAQQQPPQQQQSSGAKPNNPSGAKPNTPAPQPNAPVPGTTITPPSDYVIGPEDVLAVRFWREDSISGDFTVRPDGKISLLLVNDIQAAGLTPSELRDQITTKLAEYIPAPEVSVMVREVHSRKVAVVGAVKMPGRYEMKSPMTVLEAIALAQGLTDFASRDRIVVLRDVNGKSTQIPFNYRKIGDDGASQQNFFLRPGDIVVVP